MKRVKRVLFFIFILCVSYVAYCSIRIYQYANVDETTKSDAAIVLGAAVWGDKPSPVFEERIKHGIWLYENGYVEKIIFTGAKGEGKEYSESFIAKQYAMEHGVLAKDIFIEEESVITQENLEYAKRVMQENNISSVLIVSDPLHMKRAMLIATDLNLDAHSSPTKSSRFKTLKSKTNFLAYETFFYIQYQMKRLF